MKLYRNIIIIVAVLAVLGGTMFFISRYNPADEPDVHSTQQPDSDMTVVYKASSADVAKIHIQNANETYTVERKNGTWVLNGDASIRIKQTAIDSVAYSCTNVAVKQIISETGEDAESFGFAEPLGFADITFQDGSTKQITIGSLSLDKENYYVRLSGDANIYLKNTYGTESMIPESATLRDLVLMENDTSNLSDFRHYYMEKQGNTAVKLEYVNIGTKDAPKMQWKMLAPTYAEINGQMFTDHIINKLEKLEAVAVLEDHPKDLTVYGLHEPYATFSLGKTDGTRSYKVGKEIENYRYISEDGHDAVYLIAKSDLAFLDTAYVDLMSNLIHVEYITAIDKVEVIAPDKTYRMEIKGNEGNETYWIDDVQLKKSAFSKAYQAMIGVSLESLDFDAPPAVSPEAQIKYHKKDGTVATVVFLPVDERNYRVTVDGKGSSITNKKNLTDVFVKLEETIAQAE